MPDATLLQFAAVNDRAAATTKKLEKYDILAEYFRGIESDDDLRRAVRFAAGRPFAATDERVLNVGGALVSDVVVNLLGIAPGEYRDLVRRSGEIGEGIAEVWQTRPPGRHPADGPSGNTGTAGLPNGAAPDAALRLADLAHGFDEIASTGAWEMKRSVLHSLFSRCTHPREAAYLAKIISGDLRTGVQEGVLHDAVAKAFGRERAAIQRCHLLVGDMGDVAVLARHDRCGAAEFKLFHPLQFMLATPAETPAAAGEALAGRTFFAEDKLDGIRAQIHKSGDGAAARVAIYTRTMDRTDASFPDVVASIRRLPGEFLIDGEIVPWCDGCVMPFAHIQKRIGRKVLTPKMLRENPAVFIAFDILYRDGELLMDMPLRGRRTELEKLCLGGGVAPPPLLLRPVGEGRGEGVPDVASHPSSVTPPHLNPLPGGEGTGGGPALLITSLAEVSTADQIQSVFDASRDRRNEGIVLKDPTSPYSPGRRGQLWFKLKTHLPTLDCVVTAAEYGHGKRRAVLSDYTFAVWDGEPGASGAKLVNVGKAYSGVTDEEIARLTELFLKLSRGSAGRVHLVEPKIVLEIACDQIQVSKRHASGFAMRFPRIKRIRWDKRPEDADRLERVAEVYESTPNFARPTQVSDAPKPEPTLFDLLDASREG